VKMYFIIKKDIIIININYIVMISIKKADFKLIILNSISFV